MAQLHFSEGGRALFVHTLRPGRTVVGRSDRADLALPSDSLSRTHCFVEQRADGWWVIDRSRNGTFRNGVRVERERLLDGDQLVIGVYSARFVERSALVADGTTATYATAPVTTHEELLDLSEEGVATSKAELHVTGGPLLGRVIPLDRPRTGIGGAGSDLVLDPDLPREAAFLRVTRGRVMVEPGALRPQLEGVPIREIVPILPGESLRIGTHELEVRATTEQRPHGERAGFGAMVGRSAAMRKVFGMLSRMAGHDMPVLITGESGTGKELAARGLHDEGLRCEGPFVAINCAAIAETLFESELFGHEKGAFTGATARQDGAFQRAAGGTLFLDEVGELTPEGQAKLLRALESGEVRRVGGSKPEFPDVRVIAATNRNLVQMAREGSFREDLYFRLSVLTVRLPALRERREDIAPIATALLGRAHPGATLLPDAIAALEIYHWPGNVRELRNVLTRAFVMGGDRIGASDLSFNAWSFEEEAPRTVVNKRELDDPERRAVLDALESARGNRSAAAKILGIPRTSLLYKMQRLGIVVQ